VTVAAIIVWTFLVVIISLLAMGYAIRPYVDDLRRDRDLWKDRALHAEGSANRDDGLGDIRLIDPTDQGLPWTDPVETFLKGER
jgi:hypothetical protein